MNADTGQAKSHDEKWPGSTLLSAALDHAPIATALLAADGAVVYANRAFGDLLGADAAECQSWRYADLIENTGNVRTPEVSEPGVVARTERRYRRRDGGLVDVFEQVSVLSVNGGVSFIVQVSEARHFREAESDLAERESRWNTALASAEQGVWDNDIRRNARFYSPMWRIMRGYDPEGDLDGAIPNWIKRVHPDDRERVLEIVAKQDRGDLSFNTFDYRERHHDGHWMWILSRGKTIDWFDDGRPARVIGTDTDITALKAVEGQLAEEKERLRVTLRSIGDGVITTDADGRITFLNPVAEQFTGWQSTEAVGQTVKDVFKVVAEGSNRRVPNSVVESLARRQTYRLEQDVVLIARDGNRHSVRETAAPVIGPDGEVMGAILVFQDVSASRALQRRLAHSAMHDSLTGLPNRAAFEDALDEAIASAARESRRHALCFIDLDRFKLVNDGAGHAAGDALLQRIGDVIRRGCRDEDFAARIGGDEFALLLADCSPADAEKMARELIGSIAAVRYFWEGVFYDAGASVGITAITRDTGGPRELMDAADAACYTAKAEGRNCVRIYAGEQLGPGRFAKSA
jgi:diguanylate cyclase (GGDEF)-like protein/PAS domain S-box-containing protein